MDMMCSKGHVEERRMRLKRLPRIKRQNVLHRGGLRCHGYKVGGTIVVRVGEKQHRLETGNGGARSIIYHNSLSSAPPLGKLSMRHGGLRRDFLPRCSRLPGNQIHTEEVETILISRPDAELLEMYSRSAVSAKGREAVLTF